MRDRLRWRDELRAEIRGRRGAEEDAMERITGGLARTGSGPPWTVRDEGKEDHELSTALVRDSWEKPKDNTET